MSAEIIRAITKYQLSEVLLKNIMRKLLGENTFLGLEPLFRAKELAGGLCNAVYLVTIKDQKWVIKVAAPEDVQMMRHEANITETEADALKLLGERTDIPCPKLLLFDKSKSICPVPYFVMSFLEGTPLMTLEVRPSEEQVGEIKREIGRICAKMASIKEPYFGIPAIPKTYTNSNYHFTRSLFELLISDALDRAILLPSITGDELLSLVDACKDWLEAAEGPVLVHTDTWDGNLMIQDNKLSGLIDFAAVLYGDPLLNHDFHDFGETRREFVEGFGRNFEEGFTREEQIRIELYRIWQQLGMVVEVGYRGYEDPHRYDWVRGCLVDSIGRLRKLL